MIQKELLDKLIGETDTTTVTVLIYSKNPEVRVNLAASVSKMSMSAINGYVASLSKKEIMEYENNPDIWVWDNEFKNYIPEKGVRK